MVLILDKNMNKTLLLLIIGLLFNTGANAGEYDSLIGTMRVVFRPLSSAGAVYGCELSFETSALDYASRQGNPVLGAGGIVFYGQNFKESGVSIKLGVADILDKNHQVEAPYFAYFKTSHGTTADSKYVSHDAEMKGYRLFVPESNAKTMSVIEDIISGENPTVGFNRVKGGMDVLLPLDLTVSDTVSADNGSLKRVHSQEALNGFRNCMAEVISKLKLSK
jgi:hypothetical protein